MTAPLITSLVRDAAQAVVDRWETPLWKDVEPTAHVIARLRQALAASTPVGGWQDISTAPKDGTPIIGWCVHSANEYHLKDGYLTTYGAHVEGLGHVGDGTHVLEWGGECDGDGDGYIPDWWFRVGSDFEEAANPTHWMRLPPPPVSIDNGDHVGEAADMVSGAAAWDREICTGCTSSLSIADIKARGVVSCCPDRHMVRIGDLVDAYQGSRPQEAAPTEQAETAVVDRRPFADVFSEAYGWTVDVDGYLAGLVAGDMGYDQTDLLLSDLLVDAQVAEDRRNRTTNGGPHSWPFHEALMAFVSTGHAARTQPAEGCSSNEGAGIGCPSCEGTGKIVEEATTTGANQHSACQHDCEDCDGSGRILPQTEKGS